MSRYLLTLIALLTGCSLVPESNEDLLDPDGDGVPWSVDCDNNDASVGLPSTWYIDSDQDGLGTGSPIGTTCTQPDQTVSNDEDCNDTDASIGGPVEWFADNDGDGLGGDLLEAACTPPVGALPDSEDCDDTNPNIGLPVDWYMDGDGDSYGGDYLETACDPPAQGAPRSGDCNDTRPDVFPDSTAPEEPQDGLDMDCDGLDYCTDWNCDSLPDVVVGDYSIHLDESVLYLSDVTSQARFPPLELPIDLSFPREVEVADLDGDGRQDIVAGAPQTTIAWGSGGRTELAEEHAQIEVADVNNDGHLDLVGASDPDIPSQEVDLYLGPLVSDTSIVPDESFPVEEVSKLLVTDLDGNGLSDIVVCSRSVRSSNYPGVHSLPSFIFWDGNPQVSTELLTHACRDVTARDLNEDGHLDLVFANHEQDSDQPQQEDGKIPSYVYWGAGDQSIFQQSTTLLTVGAESVVIADFNQDGRLDVLFGEGQGDNDVWAPTLPLFLGLDPSHPDYDSAHPFADPVEIPNFGCTHPVAADLDGDGGPELICPNSEDQATYSRIFTWSLSDNMFDLSNPLLLDTGTATFVTIGDVDEDGWKDLIFADDDPDSLSPSRLLWGSPAGDYSAEVLFDLGGVSTPPVIIGGKSDLLVSVE